MGYVNGHQPMEGVTLDQLFTALASPVRRVVLLSLYDHSPRHFGDLATEVRQGSGEPRPKLVLYHTHLPRLDDVAIIDWDRDDDVIERGQHFGFVRPFLELLETNAAKVPGNWP